MTKTAKGLVIHARHQLARGTRYWYGTWGTIGTETQLAWCAKHYSKYMYASRVKYAKTHDIGKRVTDCVGLIKWYLWSDGLDDIPKYGSNGFSDVNVGQMKLTCHRRGLIDTIPEVPGTLVFMETHHIGIYDGNGWVIEAKGFDHGVVRTRLDAEPWTDWGQTSWLDYGSKVAKKPTPPIQTQLEKKQLYKVKIISQKGIWIHSKADSRVTTRIGVAKYDDTYSVTKVSGSFGYIEAEKGWISLSSKYVAKV